MAMNGHKLRGQEDYDKLIRFGELHKHDSEAAACAWLHHVGRERLERWGDWIHFSNSIRMVESLPPTQGTRLRCSFSF